MLTDDQLQRQPWVTQTGTNVNPIPSDGFRAVNIPTGALKVTNVGPTLGGALVTCKRPYLPSDPFVTMPVAYIRVKVDRFYASYELPNVGRDEFDLKAVYKSGATTPLLNQANFSTQLNMATGMWQLDPTGTGWVDTGFKPTFTPDQWQTIVYDFLLDSTKQTWGVLGVTWGTQPKFVPPSNFQNIPLITSNWQVVSALQLQSETMQAGGVTTLYNNICLLYNDQPFT